MKRGFSHLLFPPTFRRLPRKLFDMETVTCGNGLRGTDRGRQKINK